MKKETKRVNKKLLVLSLVLLSLIIISFVALVAAAAGDSTTSSSEPSFFDRWVAGNLKDFQAKLLLWLMIFAILLVLLMSLDVHLAPSLLISIPASFILIAYVTPESIIGIFKSYETLPLVLATFLPLAILFSVTYLSVVKASRTLMTTQWLLWLIYLCFVGMKIFFSAWIYWDWGYTQYISQIVTLPLEAESFWYWASTFTSGIVAAIMVFGSGSFMNWAVLKTAGLENAAATKRFNEASSALKNLSKIEKDMASSK